MSGTAPRARVLFVDDEPFVLDALSEYLRRTFDIETAVDAAQGLRLLAERGPFAAVISDFAMPGMNGLAFLSRARDVAPDAMRVLLTGQASLEHAIAAVNEGHIFRFLTKPCPPKVLLQALEDAVAQARTARESRAAVKQRLDALSDQLQRAERLASLGTLAGAVGHELNNALTPLYGAMDYIQRDVENGKLPQNKHLDTLRHAQEHLTVHARNLLHLGRPSDDGAAATDLGAAARAVVNMLSSSGVLKRVDVRVDLSPTPAVVPIPRTEVEQVLVNLVKNSVDALGEAKRPSPVIRITIAPDPRMRTVECRVTDNGGGIPQAKIPLLFEPYYTTKPADRGTGLGLFVVAQIVEKAGGAIRVDSQEGSGATFTLTLPAIAQ